MSLRSGCGTCTHSAWVRPCHGAVGTSGGLEPQALYLCRGTHDPAMTLENDPVPPLYRLTVSCLGQFVTSEPLGSRRASLWSIPRRPPQAGATRSTVSSSGCLMQCLVTHDETLGLCGLCSRGRGSASRAAGVGSLKFHVERRWPSLRDPCGPRVTPRPGW